MAASSHTWQLPGAAPAVASCGQHWYAVQTRPQHERAVAMRLREKGVTLFLPLLTEIHRWSDRRKSVEVPLFSCYVFIRITPTNEDRLKVLRTDGVFNFVGVRQQGTAIPDEQIDAVRTVVEEHLTWQCHPFLKIGQRVRIRSGALSGIEGILLSRNGDRSLVISVDAIQRSLSVRIEGYEVEPV